MILHLASLGEISPRSRGGGPPVRNEPALRNDLARIAVDVAEIVEPDDGAATTSKPQMVSGRSDPCCALRPKLRVFPGISFPNCQVQMPRTSAFVKKRVELGGFTIIRQRNEGEASAGCAVTSGLDGRQVGLERRPLVGSSKFAPVRALVNWNGVGCGVVFPSGQTGV
jgi:hypothetical protein